MTKKVLLAIVFAFATVFSVSAQKFKPAPTFLKGETQVNVVFDYSNIVFDGDSKSDYYKYKGADWVVEWEGKRKSANELSFITSFREEMAKVGMEFGSYPNAQYTLIVDVLDCDFGAFAGPMSVPAKIKADVRLVKTGTTESLSIAAKFKESQNSFTTIGTPVDFDRMYLAFGELGEEAGEILVKALK